MASRKRSSRPRTRHKSIRIAPSIQSLISARMIAENCDESAAIRSLILDGAGAARPHPVLAQVAPGEIVAQFAADMVQWHRDFLDVRSRLALALPDPKDVKLCALVAQWRKLATELEPRARVLAKTTDAVAKVLVGLDHQDLLNLRYAQENLRSNIERAKARIATMPDGPEKTGVLQSNAILEGILKALSIFAV